MYDGFLIKIGDYKFPMKYIAEQSYDTAPTQRMDNDPWKDADGVTNREVLKNKPTSVTFSLIEGITNNDVETIFEQIHKNYIDESERKVLVTYYNPETNGYPDPVYMYIANPHFPIDEIDGNTIYYKTITLELTGY